MLHGVSPSFNPKKQAPKGPFDVKDYFQLVHNGSLLKQVAFKKKKFMPPAGIIEVETPVAMKIISKNGGNLTDIYRLTHSDSECCWSRYKIMCKEIFYFFP